MNTTADQPSALAIDMIRYAKRHGMSAYHAGIDEDTVAVIIPWTNGNSSGADVEYAHTFAELREILGY